MRTAGFLLTVAVLPTLGARGGDFVSNWNRLAHNIERENFLIDAANEGLKELSLSCRARNPEMVRDESRRPLLDALIDNAEEREKLVRERTRLLRALRDAEFGRGVDKGNLARNGR